MRSFYRKAAILLLPCIIRALVLPDQIATSHSDEPSRFDFESSTYGGPSTFFEYDIDDHSIKFAIPCPDCSDEEKELLKHEILSIKPTRQNTQSCTSVDPIGLEIDGKQLISTGESSLALQSHIGPFDLEDHATHHIFNRTRWINHCGCTKKHLDDETCDGDFESSLSFEVLGLPSGQIPGFTLSYKQNGRPELLRFSTFPDIGIADSWRYGRSAHYKSPLLKVQKAVIPTSTAILSSSITSPSTTSSALSPSYTHFEKTPLISSENPPPASSTPGVLGFVSQSSDSTSRVSDIPVAGSTEHTHTRWCHPIDALVAIGHGLSEMTMNAQRVLGKRPSQTSLRKLPDRPTAIEDLDHKFEDVLHDELDEPRIGDGDDADDGADEDEQSPPKGFFHVDVPSTPPYLEDPTTIKAFQVTSLVFIVVALSGSIFALLRRNPRLRAKWASVLEEKRNERLYRQAARKYRFQNFFSKIKPSGVSEKNDLSLPQGQYDDALDWQEWEKRTSLDVAKHSKKEDAYAIHRDLVAFRKAHQFVDGIITAEEGGSRSQHGRRPRPTPRTRHSRAWSFGSEKTAPPPYESEGEDIVLDADGPRFVVIRRRSDISPDSSVVSTSPRTSCADSDSERDEKF